MTNFFNKEPEISWKKVLCPICNEPTGPKSECYKNIPKGMAHPHKRKIVSKNGIVPIYSFNCGFRQDNLWEATINYPVSKILLSKLANIGGVERIFATKTNTFQVSIGKLFDDNTIKQLINQSYRGMIKEWQTKELGSYEPYKYDIEYNGIILPNGQKFVSFIPEGKDAVSQSLIFADILKNIPASSGILANQLEK